MKAYILKDEDFEALIAALSRDPARGGGHKPQGRLTEEEARIYEEAHRFFNYHAHVWIQKMRA